MLKIFKQEYMNAQFYVKPAYASLAQRFEFYFSNLNS